MSSLVTVARFWDGPEMYAALAALRSGGLHPCAAEFHHAMVNPLLYIGLGGVRILVPENEAELAEEIIRQCQAGEPAGDSEAGLGEAVNEDGQNCPRCGSPDFFRLKSWLFALGFYLAWSLYAPLTTGRLLCRACGHKWREQEAAA